MSDHFTKETYFRLIATELLPNSISRILYLDPDIIIQKNLQNFYYQSFVDQGDEKSIIACEDTSITGRVDVYENLGMPLDAKYFNAGVLLLNLDKLRKLCLSNSFFQFIRDHDEQLLFLDQDVLNAFFYNDVIFAENKYNLLLCNISKDSSKIEDAYVLHYAGPKKPWKYGYSHGAGNIYIQYAKKAGVLHWFLYNRVKSMCTYKNTKLFLINSVNMLRDMTRRRKIDCHMNTLTPYTKQEKARRMTK